MDKKEAQRLLENYIFMRDVRIPAIERQIANIEPCLTPNYSGSIRGSDVSDPAANLATKKLDLETKLAQTRAAIITIESVKEFLGKECGAVFQHLIYPRKLTWEGAALQTGLTEKEFRIRRNKIIKYMRAPFDGLSLWCVYDDLILEGRKRAEKGQKTA